MPFSDDATSARLMKFKNARDFYFGNARPVLKVTPGQPDFNVQVNFARQIADTAVSYLFGGDLDFELESEFADATIFLNETLKRSKKMTLFQGLGLDGAITGHCFLKIVQRSPFPRIIGLDPSTVTPIFSPDDIDNITAYRIEFETETGKIRQLIEQTDDGLWKITDQVKTGNSTWKTKNVEVWPWEWPPLLHCQNLPVPHDFWGMADLEPDVLRLQQSANLTLSNVEKILMHHAHPKTVIHGSTPAEIENSPSDTLVLQGDNAGVTLLEMHSDLGASITFFGHINDAILQVSRTPEVTTGKLHNIGRLSGLALKILYGPLQHKVQTKQMLYGDMLEEMCRRILALGGFGENMNVTLKWPDVVPVDPQAEALTAQSYLALGVSRDTVLSSLGFNAPMENQKRLVELAAEPQPTTDSAEPKAPKSTATGDEESPADNSGNV